MPRTNIPVTAIPKTVGVAPPAVTAGDATNDHSFVNDGRTFLEIKNTDAATQVVTIVTPYTVESLAVDDVTVSIPTGATRLIGPFNAALFGQPTDASKVWVDITVANFEFRAYSLSI